MENIGLLPIYGGSAEAARVVCRPVLPPRHAVVSLIGGSRWGLDSPSLPMNGEQRPNEGSTYK